MNILYEIAKIQHELSLKKIELKINVTEVDSYRQKGIYNLEDYIKKYDFPGKCYIEDENGEVEYYSINLNARGAYPENGASIYGFPKSGRMIEGYVENYAYNDEISLEQAVELIEKYGLAYWD